eukprot:5382218-Pyramimonas_sp.AAC.1
MAPTPVLRLGGPVSGQGVQDGPRWLQNGLRWTKMTYDMAQDSPRWVKMTSDVLPRVPKKALRRLE